MPSIICRHIRLNGDRCGSPALADQPFCYFHDRSFRRHRPLTSRNPEDDMPTIIHPIPKDHLDRMQREPILADYYSGTALANRRATEINLDIPPLEDRDSIQLALSMLITAMAQNRIETRRATGILYGLQVASTNAARPVARPSRSRIVTQVTLDDTGNELAPDVDPASELDFQDLLTAIAKSDFNDDDDFTEPKNDEDDED